VSTRRIYDSKQKHMNGVSGKGWKIVYKLKKKILRVWEKCLTGIGYNKN
jgi:hypothetical protein